MQGLSPSSGLVCFRVQQRELDSESSPATGSVATAPMRRSLLEGGTMGISPKQVPLIPQNMVTGLKVTPQEAITPEPLTPCSEPPHVTRPTYSILTGNGSWLYV